MSLQLANDANEEEAETIYRSKGGTYSLTPGGERGCGKRVPGGLYLCVGLAPWGKPLETFVVDPPRPWIYGAFRSPILVPNSTSGVNDCLMWVGAESYPYAPDFLEECLLPEEKIVTANGLTPISCLQCGEEVLTHRGRFRRITDTVQRSYCGELVEIHTQYWSDPIRLTPRHPLLMATVLRGGARRKREGVYGTKVIDRSFVAAEELRKGDMLCYPTLADEVNTPEVIMSYTKTYPDSYTSSQRTPEIDEYVRTLRCAPGKELLPWQHRLLMTIHEGGDVARASLVFQSQDIYRWAPGMYRALRHLVRKGFLQKPARGVYALTTKGKDAAKHKHLSYKHIAKRVGLCPSVVGRILSPHGKTHVVLKRVPVNDALCRLIGYYLAEGSVACTWGAHKDRWYVTEFSFGKTTKEHGFAMQVFRDAETLGFSASISTKEGCYHVVVHSRHLAHFMAETFGTGAPSKHIPLWVLRLPRGKLVEVFTAYLQGDGTYRNGRWVGATTASEALAHGLMLIANKAGYRAGCRRTPPAGMGKHPLYRISLSYDPTRGSVWADAQYLYLPITSVRRLPYAGDVYNLTVEEDESYCTFYHTLHNCRSMGVSKRIPAIFPVQQLTPMQSRIILIHPKAFPMVDEGTTPCYYDLTTRKDGCHLNHPLSGVQEDGHCTFALWNLSAYKEASTEGHLVTPAPTRGGATVITTPSITYPAVPPVFPPTPPPMYRPGVVAAFWITHCEYIGDVVPDEITETCGEMPVHPMPA